MCRRLPTNLLWAHFKHIKHCRRLFTVNSTQEMKTKLNHSDTKHGSSWVKVQYSFFWRYKRPKLFLIASKLTLCHSFIYMLKIQSTPTCISGGTYLKEMVFNIQTLDDVMEGGLKNEMKLHAYYLIWNVQELRHVHKKRREIRNYWKHGD